MTQNDNAASPILPPSPPHSPMLDPQILEDPPPPYPTRQPGRGGRVVSGGSRRARRSQQTSIHTQHASGDSDSPLPGVMVEPTTPNSTEHTLNDPLSPNPEYRNGRRARALSFSSTILSSGAASVRTGRSIARTVASLFQSESDDEYDAEEDGHDGNGNDGLTGHGAIHIEDDEEQLRVGGASDGSPLIGFNLGHRFSVQTPSPSSRLNTRTRMFMFMKPIKRYFRPLGKSVYWLSIFHLLLLNFPYALAAWIFLFVLTLTGTILLVALPLGAFLCFFNLLGARAFSRGELALQTRFHGPLLYPPPYPPRPLFTRMRDPTPSEVESSGADPTIPVPETSFYKNTYAMFTDSTSYQALFYFLVIKPAITLLLSILLAVVVPVSLVLVLPAPAIFRASRKIGIWQANVAVEGLYFAVR